MSRLESRAQRCCARRITRAADRGEEGELREIPTELSDKSVTYLRRRSSDLVEIVTDLTKSFSEEDGEAAARALLLDALQRVKQADKQSFVKTKLGEVEKVLKNIISLSCEYAQLEAVLTFFEAAPFDQAVKFDYDLIQDFFRSPVTEAEIWRSNGFCLANTETILYDSYLLKKNENLVAVHSGKCGSKVLPWTQARYNDDDGKFCNEETALNSNPGIAEKGCTGNELHICDRKLLCLQLEICETDILE